MKLPTRFTIKNKMGFCPFFYFNLNIYSPNEYLCAGRLRLCAAGISHFSTLQQKTVEVFRKKITFNFPKKTVDFLLNLCYHIITGKR